MEIVLQDHSRATIIEIRGRINIRSSPDLQETFKAQIGNKAVVIDLSQVDYMDSSGVGVLVAGLKHAMEKRLAFNLAGVNGRVKDVLEITKLNDLFSIYPDVTSALSAAQDQ